MYGRRGPPVKRPSNPVKSRQIPVKFPSNPVKRPSGFARALRQIRQTRQTVKTAADGPRALRQTQSERGSDTQAKKRRRRPRGLAETGKGELGLPKYVDIMSRSLRPPRSAEYGALGRLRRIAGRARRADAVQERGSDTRAKRQRRRPRGLAKTIMGGLGLPKYVDIMSRILRPP